MASGDTKTESFLRAAAEGSREDLPSEGCCNTKTQNLILGVANRIMDVEDEVERLENNPDVVDIVATYADLEDYDTSGLTDKDIIRVLEDSTHNNNSTYYRWNSTTSQFDFVGEIAGAGGGSAIELTETDFNYPSGNPTAVALWLLPPGVYYTTTLTTSTNASASQVLASTSTQLLNQQNMTTFLTLEGYGGVKTIIGANGNLPSSLFKSSQVFSFLNVDNTGNYQGGSVLLQKTNVKDSLTSTSTDTPLSANQGKVLNDKITALEARVGGLTLVSISQTDYDALTTKDPNTLYVITGA